MASRARPEGSAGGRTTGRRHPTRSSSIRRRGESATHGGARSPKRAGITDKTEDHLCDNRGAWGWHLSGEQWRASHFVVSSRDAEDRTIPPTPSLELPR